jgi:hypothetical protein
MLIAFCFRQYTMATTLKTDYFGIKKGNTYNIVFPSCSTYGNRTRDSSVKGRRLNPLTNAPFVLGLQR